MPLSCLQDFLLLEEHGISLSKSHSQETTDSISLDKEKSEIILEKVNASWTSHEEHTLRDVSFSVKAGQLMGIIGPVASGKACFKKKPASRQLATRDQKGNS